MRPIIEKQKIQLGKHIGKYFDTDDLIELSKGIKIGLNILKDNGVEELLGYQKPKTATRREL